MQIRVNNPRNQGLANVDVTDGITLGQFKEEACQEADRLLLNGRLGADPETPLSEGDSIDVIPGKPDGSGR